MTRLTEKFGDCTEFEVIKTNGPASYSVGDRLTLEYDHGDDTAQFYNHRTKLKRATYINNIKPYVAEIKQFDLVDVRDGGGKWFDKPRQFIADLTETHAGIQRPIIVLRDNGFATSFKEMRPHVPKSEVKVIVDGVEIELNEETIKLILEQQDET
jgi:hypothetical protein